MVMNPLHRNRPLSHSSGASSNEAASPSLLSHIANMASTYHVSRLQIIGLLHSSTHVGLRKGGWSCRGRSETSSKEPRHSRRLPCFSSPRSWCSPARHACSLHASRVSSHVVGVVENEGRECGGRIEFLPLHFLTSAAGTGKGHWLCGNESGGLDRMCVVNDSRKVIRCSEL